MTTPQPNNPDPFAQSEQRWRAATGQGNNPYSSEQYSAGQYSTANPIQDYSAGKKTQRHSTAEKKSLREKFAEASALGEEFNRWLEDEDAQRVYAAKYGTTAAEDMNPIKLKRGKILVIVFAAFILLSIFGAVATSQYRYMQGECQWATWTEYDRDKEYYVDRWSCIEEDDPRLDDPDFTEKVEFKNPWDWLRKRTLKEPTQK